MAKTPSEKPAKPEISAEDKAEKDLEALIEKGPWRAVSSDLQMVRHGIRITIEDTSTDFSFSIQSSLFGAISQNV